MRKLIIILTILFIASCGESKKDEMGILGKVFKKKESKEIPEEWDFYFSNVDDKLGSIAVNLGLNGIAPIQDQNNVVWVSVKMNNPREDGLSSSEEFETLGQIEDSLVAGIRANHSSTFVGRLTSVGLRDFYFYLSDTTLYDKTISEAMVAFPNYQFDFGSKEDKDWGGYYDFLFPTPQQYQCIMNRRVIQNLEEGGDDLTKAREVDHWIYFKTESDREDYLSKIKADGFTVVDKIKDESWGESPYQLHIKRVDNVDQESVDDYVIYLWKLANECNGEYDGWETSIEKN